MDIFRSCFRIFYLNKFLFFQLNFHLLGLGKLYFVGIKIQVHNRCVCRCWNMNITNEFCKTALLCSQFWQTLKYNINKFERFDCLAFGKLRNKHKEDVNFTYRERRTIFLNTFRFMWNYYLRSSHTANKQFSIFFVPWADIRIFKIKCFY